MENILTVFIDLDDTIWWFSENSLISLRHVYNVFSIARFCPDYEWFKSVYTTKNKELWDLYHYGMISTDFLKTERFRFTLWKTGYKGNCVELAKRMDEEYLSFLSLQSTLVPGAKELLEYLVDKGYEVNVLSNGFKNVQSRKLKSAGVAHYINRIILSDDCGITKPMPGIFEYALCVCGASPATSVMIGDNFDADIRGAHNAGWRTIFFNKNGEPIQESSVADFSVDKLLDIKHIL